MKKGISIAIKIAISLIILGIVLLVRFHIVKQDDFSVTKYILVDVTGADSRGQASASLDEIGIYAALAGADADADAKAVYHDFVESIRYSLDRTDNLTNGDTITLTVTYSESEAKSLKLDIKESEKKITVTGLAECTKLDLFANLKIITGGISPFMTATYSNESDLAYVQSLQYELDKTNNIAIGDTITVTCLADADSALAQGYFFDQTTMEYTIETADYYVEDIADVPEDVLAGIEEDDLAAIQSATNDTTSHMTYAVTGDKGYLYRDGNEEAVNFTYIGSQLARNATTSGLEHENYLIAFYKGQLRIPNFSDSEDPYDYIDATFAFLYNDLIVTTEGDFRMATNEPELRYVCGTTYDNALQAARNRIGAGYSYTEYEMAE